MNEILDGSVVPNTGNNKRGIRPYVKGYYQLVFQNEEWVNNEC